MGRHGAIVSLGVAMRSVFGLISLLIVMAVVLLLAARQTRQTVRTVNAPIPSLREDVSARAFDRETARRLIERLDALADEALPPEADLLAARQTAAEWAAGSAPGSGDYRCAVKLRGAADALLAAGRGDEGRRGEARRLLQEARAALDSGAAMPGGAVGAIRDQLENLQQSQRERLDDAQRQID